MLKVAKSLKNTVKLTQDWMLVEVLDAKARSDGEKTPGGLYIPATVKFTGLRHCRVKMIGPGLLDREGQVIKNDVSVMDYVLIAGEDLVAEIETSLGDLKGHFAQARFVVAYGPNPIQ